jgi:hypothetical protein
MFSKQGEVVRVLSLPGHPIQFDVCSDCSILIGDYTGHCVHIFDGDCLHDKSITLPPHLSPPGALFSIAVVKDNFLVKVLTSDPTKYVFDMQGNCVCFLRQAGSKDYVDITADSQGRVITL